MTRVTSAMPIARRADEPAKILFLRKRFEPSEALARTGGPKPTFGHVDDVPSTPFADNPHTRLQLLLPDEIEYDMAMNVFTFDPGYGLPYVETHVMEHGLYFYATGPVASKYIYYKNVNREIVV